MKTLLITGNIGAGKSSFINKILMVLNIDFIGLRSVRRFENKKIIGFDMCILENYNPIQTWSIAQLQEGKPKMVGDFQKATDYLDAILSNSDESKLVFIDELGRFERNDLAYLSVIEKLVDSNVPTIISLKKEDLPFNNYLIEKAKKDKSIECIDLDECDEEFANLLICSQATEKIYDTKEKIYYSGNVQADYFIDKTDGVDYFKVYDIFKMTSEDFFESRKYNEMLYFYTDNIDEMKRAADIGLMVISTLDKRS
ncbi:MAG: nucleoside-triphosphatase [Eubacteriales bacterium]|nr:nucleoside-triphosphatase [Eubacteriales bacterium]MDY3333186.1 nucleoside-triphosphatase [Gallibacter sp.]